VREELADAGHVVAAIQVRPQLVHHVEGGGDLRVGVGMPYPGFGHHFPPQRQRGGSPFSRQTTNSSAASAIKPIAKDPGARCGGNVRTTPTTPSAMSEYATQPCQAVGSPQPQPYRFALNH
jgi:hypothetical protein